MSEARKPHSTLPSDERIAEYVEGAKSVLEDDLPAGHKLWKSWALDLADNVLALARKLDSTQEQLEAARDVLRGIAENGACASDSRVADEYLRSSTGAGGGDGHLPHHPYPATVQVAPEPTGEAEGSASSGRPAPSPATRRCEKCQHEAHEPGACGENVGTGYQGAVLCRCGVSDPARKPGRSSECGHSWWVAGCTVCEREKKDALAEQSPASEPDS